MNEDGPWTLDELAARVAAELAVDYPGAPSGRVRDVPDRRAIRWYTTIGLVDRPLGMRGRTALYGPRHVLQLVAVKRRQAAGRTLAEIQAELAGATDRTLRAIAGPPADSDDADHDETASAEPIRDEPIRDEPIRDGRAGRQVDGKAGPRRARFWASPAAAVMAPVPEAPSPEPPEPVEPVGVVAGRAVVLAGGVTVVLPGAGREVSAADLVAIGAAAGPLVEVLVRRGLVLVDDDGERSGGS